jgi:nucleoid-associated protein YgaU
MNLKRPSRRALSDLHCACGCALLCAVALFAVPGANAQDAAEAAHREKARRAAQSQKSPSHVYTNEDLQRAQILTPEDRAPIEARKKKTAPPALNEISPANAPTQDAAASESLGEIARRVHREKAARQAEQARKLPPPSLFPMELPQPPVLAHPKPLIAPSPALASPPSTRAARPFINAATSKRDPFSRATPAPVQRNFVSAPALKPPMVKSPVSKLFVPSAALPKPLQLGMVAPDVAQPKVASPLVAPSVVVTRPSSADAKIHPSSIRIRPGDSLWNLSRQYLGKSSLWEEWLSRNPQLGDPRRLQPGAILFVPYLNARPEPASVANSDLRSAPDSEQRPPITVSVQPGDSLWKIAAKNLGHATNWPCLARANPALRDANRIYPDQTLQLPAACAAPKSAAAWPPKRLAAN